LAVLPQQILLLHLILFATALRAGKILADPYLLRQVNDVLTPKEVEAILKGGKALGTNQAGLVNPKLYLAGLTKKREAFARFMNKAFGDDDDYVPVDPKNVDLEKITEYLNSKQVEMIQPNFGENADNVPGQTIAKMYDEEIMGAPNQEEAAEEENFIQGGIAGSKEFNNTFLPESQIKKLDVGDDDEPVQAQPMLNQQAQATPATGQVNANRFAALFPNDSLGAAIAQRGMERE
jgi:hypothetical protein